MPIPLRVLIIEDSPDDAELMVLHLTKGGFQPEWQRVQTEPDYLAALGADLDLILADWRLPNFSGLRALKLMNERGLDIPFIIVSGSIGEETAIDALRQGVGDYVLKDRPARLGQAVQHALEDKQLRQGRKWAEEALILRMEQLVALNQASQAVTTSLDLDQVLTEVMSLAGKVVGSEYTSIVLVDEAGHISRGVENMPGVLSIERRARKRGFTNWILRARRPAVVDEIGEDGVIRPRVGEGAPRTANPHLVAEGIKSFVGLPLIVEERTVGVLYLHSLHPGVFGDQLPLLTTFANQAAIAIEKARLYDAVQKELAERKQAEEALQRERDTAQQYLDIAGVLMAVLNTDGQITLINQKGCEILGYEESELIGRNWFDTCLSEDAREGVRGVFERLMAGDTEPVKYYENAVLTKSGAQRILAFHNSFIQDQASQITGILFSGEDITERKQAEEALAQERNLLRSLIDNVPDYIYVKDTQSRFMIVNTALAHLVGSSTPDDLLGKTDFDFFPQELAAKYYADDRGLFQSGQALLECEESTLDNAGNPRWISTNKVPLRDAQGNIFGMVGMGREITERKQAEAALAKERSLLRALTDNIPDGIYFKDLESRFLLINHAQARRFGLSDPAQAIGKTDFDFFTEEHARPAYENERAIMQSGQPVVGKEEKETWPDGRVGWVSTTKMPLRDEKGNIVGTFGISRDITERKQAVEALARQAEELRQRNEELARLYRASGSLISGTLLRYQDLAQTIVEIVQQEFGQSNCSLLVVQKDSNELVRLVASGSYADRVKYQNLALDGPGLIPLAIRTNKVVNVGDVHSAPDYVQGWEAAQSELAIPLKVGSDVIGAVDVQSSEPNAFSPDDERLMTVFAGRAALALEHGRLNAQTEARLQQLTALRTVDMAISGSFDINLTLGVLLDQVTGQLGVHAVDILVFNATTQTFKFACERGFRTQLLQHTQLKFGAGYAWRAIRERRVIVVPDIQVEPDGLQRSPDLSGEQFVAYLGIPLIAKGQIKGVLEVFHREPLDLEKERYGFLEMLAGQAAIAIDNAELFDRLQSSNADLTMAYNSTLEGWASALELRDKETEGHTRRVTELTIQLARALGVKENDMVHIYRGALLHDIGKVGVPDSIVLKPGPLTEDEWIIMRKHPQYAYNMLSPIAYLRLALDIPYCHHEKWDGTGYPRRLKGEQIPLAARIFAVVDVWDALISDRPYRKAWQEAKARQYIQEQAGLYFDPQVVQAFLKESFKKG